MISGSADHRFVEHLLLAQPVVAQVVAVVGGEDDHRVVHQTALLHEGEEPAELVVDLLDQTHVARHHRVAHLRLREGARDAVAIIARVHGMGVSQLASERTKGSASSGRYMLA
jgi:hypothetical protein